MRTRSVLLSTAFAFCASCFGGSNETSTLAFRYLAQEPDQGLPVVTAASVPFYPRTALLANVVGTAVFRVTTDGQKISFLKLESGPPMLARAAKDNIQTWQFEDDKPTTFSVTFQYRIEEPPQCTFDNATVVLHMPSDVQITTKGVHTCDPAVERKH